MSDFRDNIEQAIETLPLSSQERDRRRSEIDEIRNARPAPMTHSEFLESMSPEERQAFDAKERQLHEAEVERERQTQERQEAERLRDYLAAAPDIWREVNIYSYIEDPRVHKDEAKLRSEERRTITRIHMGITSSYDVPVPRERSKETTPDQRRVASQILALITEDGEFVCDRLSHRSGPEIDKWIIDPLQRIVTPKRRLIPRLRTSAHPMQRNFHVGGWMLTADAVKVPSTFIDGVTQHYPGDGDHAETSFTPKIEVPSPDIYPHGLMLGMDGRPFSWYSDSKHTSPFIPSCSISFSRMYFAKPITEGHIAAKLSQEDLGLPIEQQRLVVSWQGYLGELIQRLTREDAALETAHQRRLAQLRQTS